MAVVKHEHFVYRQTMIVEHDEETAVAGIAAAIGEPARTRILYCLLDGRARTSTELAMVAEVSPSTGSVHLQRLVKEGLIRLAVQGKHRYYSLAGVKVARALETLSVLAGKTHKKFVPNTPSELRFARTCYDHVAGTVGVLLHDRFKEIGWIVGISSDSKNAYDLSAKGVHAIESIGIDLGAIRDQRRRFAFGCLDWSERRPHIGGAFGAALLEVAVKKRWVERDLDSRSLSITNIGKREFSDRFGIRL